MPDIVFDREKHFISKQLHSKTDTLLSLLCEGIFTSRPQKKQISFLWPLKRAIDEITGTFFRRQLMRPLPVIPNRIVFAAFQESYACNCKYIAEKIIERKLDYELIFLVSSKVYENREDYDLPDEIYLVKKHTTEAFCMLATARFWIDNGLNCIWKPIPKKPEQIYLNTWHGSLGIKKLGGNKYWRMTAKRSRRQIDAFLTDSTFDEEVFHSSFWPGASYLKFGHPRNDLFFNKEKMELLRQKVHRFYQLPDDVKLALYAPTFRSNKSDLRAINIDCSRLKNALESRYGGQWMILNRLHYHNAAFAAEKRSDASFVLDASTYPDMQELLAAAEVGITDYSSWIFDFLFTGRPGFIYATDIEHYIHDRGFYYPLNETPFSIAASAAQLEENIQSFDEVLYNRKVSDFLKRLGCYESGTACEQTVDYIVEHTLL